MARARPSVTHLLLACTGLVLIVLASLPGATHGQLVQLPPYKPYRTAHTVNQQAMAAVATILAAAYTVVGSAPRDELLPTGPVCGALIFFLTHAVLANDVTLYHAAAGTVLGALAHTAPAKDAFPNVAVFGTLFCGLIAWSMATATHTPAPIQIAALCISALIHGLSTVAFRNAIHPAFLSQSVLYSHVLTVSVAAIVIAAT